jgi:hypothetical protein
MNLPCTTEVQQYDITLPYEVVLAHKVVNPNIVFLSGRLNLDTSSTQQAYPVFQMFVYGYARSGYLVTEICVVWWSIYNVVPECI